MIFRHAGVARLRALVDASDGTAAAAEAGRHLAACRRCRARYAGMRDAARFAEARLGVPPEPPMPFEVARSRTLASMRRSAARPHARGRHLTPIGGALTAALAVATTLLVTVFAPLRSIADGVLAVFTPLTVAPIALSAADVAALRSLPDPRAYGSVRVGRRGPDAAVPTADLASLAVRYPVRVPHAPPWAAPRDVQFRVIGRTVERLTFSAPQAVAYAAAHGIAAARMPPALDGSTLEATIGPVVVETVGERDAARSGAFGLPPIGPIGPRVAIVQLPVPTVVSTGASTAAIEGYLLQSPGITPHLAAQLAALGDLTHTLPIPMPIDRAYVRPALVHGVAAVAFGDASGTYDGDVWQESGMLYAVYGRLSVAEATALAETLLP